MKLRSFAALILSVAMLLPGTATFAFETDQYNLPPEPLSDIGDEVTEYVIANLEDAVDAVNNRISKGKNCLAEAGKGCDPAEKISKDLKYLLSNDAIADELYDRLGYGTLFVTKFGMWMRSHEFQHQPASYKTGYGESIFVALPTNYLTISPTVRLYGVNLGVDKLEHLLQQGYKYHKIKRNALASGQTTEQAEKKAVAWGQRTERTYFGTLVSGVYSNADLYANFAGMKFYDGLSTELDIDGEKRPPVVKLVDDRWQLAKDSQLRAWLLKPFITDHMNEAFNPSGYTLLLIRSIRRTIKKNSCPEWHRQYPTLTKAALKTKTLSLEKWNGEDYGFTHKKRMIDLAEICFDDQDQAEPKP